MRPSGRQINEMRNVTIETNVTMHAEGSCLIKCGNTHVLCTATIDDRVPPFMKNSGLGWGDGGIRDAATRDEYTDAARSQRGPVRPHARNTAPDRAVAARRCRPCGLGVNGKSS